MLAFLARIRRGIPQGPRRLSGRTPLDASLVVVAVAVTVYVVVAPLSVSRYVPMTDLPFHATSGATFRHYWDPSYHLREQFVLRPFAVPYMSMYALVGALMLVFPVLLAVKIAVFVHLTLVPLGLAVLFHGAKKSPLLGLLGLGMCWGNLTHWGFLNYVAALGLFSMVVGATLLVLDRPTAGRRVLLALALVALHFTHMFRVPFALAAVAGTAIVMYPATRRIRPLLLPILPSVVLFYAWWKLRPAALDAKLEFALHTERFRQELAHALTDGFTDDGVRAALARSFDVGWAVAITCAVHALVRLGRRLRRVTAWDVGVTIVPLCCAAVFFVLFLVMPLWLGPWWYVYPREATAATIILFGACPDLPRTPWLRVPLVVAMASAGVRVGREVAVRYADFAAQTEDFYQITREIPKAPKLFYMIFDHGGTRRAGPPFIHLPAYVQAEKGGWLSWHFAIWNVSPLQYRTGPGAVVVPRTPPRWEWTPGQFNLRMTPFFDTFLVRQKASPDALFAKDPTIRRVDHVGMWWLYRRVPAQAPPAQ